MVSAMEKRFKEIFVFVAGETPQVITETIYALSQQNPPVYPDEIFIITTSRGKVAVTEALINRGILNELILEYSLPPIEINENSFILIRDYEGNLIDDIRNEADNKSVGDLITSFIKEKTASPTTRLYCSLAGGRKTMGFYLGTALQLFGRTWDHLFHVLVSFPFEGNPQFFYKPKKNKLIPCRLADGSVKLLSTAQAEVHLSDLPFIRLRHKFKLDGSSFSELVARGQEEIDLASAHPILHVSLADRTIQIGEVSTAIPPVQLFIYVTFLRQKTDYCPHPQRQFCLDCEVCFKGLYELFDRDGVEKNAEDYRKIYRGHPFKTEEFLSRRPRGYMPEVIRQNISKINTRLKQKLGSDLALSYFIISSIKKYGASRYGLKAEKSKIIIE